jgi:hypothetical protein
MVTVGVSGHRSFRDIEVISKAVDTILQKIQIAYGEEPIRVISPLAEGADRLVAKRAFELYSAQLIVPLPFEMSVYMQDFKSNDSKEEFSGLVDRAAEVILLPAKSSRGESFLAVGLYVLNKCDVLIAIWDGEPARGTGGTAQIVDEARKQGKPIAWLEVKNQGKTMTIDSDSTDSTIHYERFPNRIK